MTLCMQIAQNEAMENTGLKLRIPVHVQDYNSFDVFLFCFKSVNT